MSSTWAERRSRWQRRSRERTTTWINRTSHWELAGTKQSPSRTIFATSSPCSSVTHRSTPDGAHASHSLTSTPWNGLFRSARPFQATSFIKWSTLLALFARTDRHLRTQNRRCRWSDLQLLSDVDSILYVLRFFFVFLIVYSPSFTDP